MVDRLTENRSRVAWWGVGVALALVASFVVVEFVGTLVFAVFLYYATRPVYRRVEPRIGSPGVAAAASLVLLALPALLLVGYVIAVGAKELSAFAGDADLGPVEDAFSAYPDVSELVASPEQVLADGGVDVLLDVGATVTSYLGLFGTVALHAFVVFALAFYLLRDDHRLSTWILTDLSNDPAVLDAYLTAVDRDLNSIFFGNILNAAITGTIGAVVYTALNLVAPSAVSIPYAVLAGLLTGIASLVPMVGMKLVYVPVGAYLFGRALLADASGVLWFPAAFVAVSVVVVDFVPDLVVRPYVSGRNLHVGMVMLAYVLGPLLFGWYGIFLAPLLLVLAVHFARIVLPALVTGDPLDPPGSGPATVPEPAADGAPATETADSSGGPTPLDEDAAGANGQQATPGGPDAGERTPAAGAERSTGATSVEKPEDGSSDRSHTGRSQGEGSDE